MKVLLSIFGPTTPGEDASQVAAGLRCSGADSLLFFTSLYHGYRLIQPRYPDRAIYTLETDRVFYAPDYSLYADCVLKPDRSVDSPNTDHVAELTEACHREGLSFSALVPICAAGRLTPAHPELAVENLYGAKDRMFLCYNNPEVRKYRMAMVTDIVGRYPVDSLMLDKIPQTMLEQRAQNGFFDPPLRTVGSLCFCVHCREKAAHSGLDLEAVHAKCREIADRSLRIPPHIIAAQEQELSGDTEIPLLLLEEPLLYEMLQFRFRTALELVREIRDLAKSLRPSISVEAAFVPPSHVGHDMTAPRSWLTVQSYRKYADVLDRILCVVHFDPDVVRFETERAVVAGGGKTKVTTSMRLYGPTRPQEVASLAEAALAGGSEGVSFLGYDVASDELLKSLDQWSKRGGF
jgi:hypothetical protein